LAKTSATATDYALSLATLGDATQIGSFLFYAVPPKVAKAIILSCHWRWFICVVLLKAAKVGTATFVVIGIRVTRLGNFLPVGLLLEAHYDFLKG
jgi:hypothetical protein